eukprot:gene748-28_t
MNIEEALEIIKAIKDTELYASDVLNSNEDQMLQCLDRALVRLKAALRTLSKMKIITEHGLTNWDMSSDERTKLAAKVLKLSNNMQKQLKAITSMKTFQENNERYKVREVHEGQQGRPTKHIGIQQLETLLNLGFSLTEKTFITDPELDIAIHRITTRNPRLGIVMIQGELRSCDVWVPRDRIRESLLRMDPVNVLFRKTQPVKRRQYKVDAPNSLWHIDCNLKLAKKFGIAIHGAIDGCSRKILYMEACNDKTAETTNARTKKRKNPTPHCVGSSVHNQRIERLWVDVRHCVTQLFMDMFFDLQSASLLDKDNPVDFYCARAVFTTTVNFQLQKFKTHWNNHSMSTQSQATPNQVFVSGAMKRHGSGLEEVAGMINAKPLENTNDNDNENEEHDPLVPENETEEEVAELLPAINDVSVPETKKEELQILFACSGDDLDLGWSRYLHARSLFS